jgi:hypothetical protein
MTNSDKKETFTWFLIAVSPITFGLLIVAAITILIAKHYGLNLNEDGIIILPIYFTYTFLWARIYRKFTGSSWLN